MQLYDIGAIRTGERKRKADPEKVKSLVKSIHEIGLINPIAIAPDGKLHAGLHRLEACRLLGWDQIPVTVLDLDELRSELAEIDENLIRNNLTELQEGVQLARRKTIYEQLYPETKHGATGRGGKKDANIASFSDDAAEKTGKSKRTISNKTRIGEQLTDIADDLEDTPIADSQKDLLALAGMQPEQRQEVVDHIKSGDADSVNKALTHIRNERKKQAVTQVPDGVFNVIYADPPWEYNNTGVHGAAEHHYPTMSTEDLCDLLEREKFKVDKNAVLFLWVTNPLLQDALYVVNAWGFEYKTNIVWVKTDLVKPGSGFYVRGRHELLLICTKGSFTPLNPNISPPVGSVITAPVQEHSRKPDEVYGIIEQLYPECNYLELFARRPRNDWQAWGNDLHAS